MNLSHTAEKHAAMLYVLRQQDWAHAGFAIGGAFELAHLIASFSTCACTLWLLAAAVVVQTKISWPLLRLGGICLEACCDAELGYFGMLVTSDSDCFEGQC